MIKGTPRHLLISKLVDLSNQCEVLRDRDPHSMGDAIDSQLASYDLSIDWDSNVMADELVALFVCLAHLLATS